MRIVNIVGKAPGYEKSKDIPGETWAVSSVYNRLQKLPDKIFELHADAKYLQPHADRLVVRNYQGFRCEILPVDELIDYFGNRFGSSISWMVGYAILQKYEQINIIGVNMLMPAEYLRQRDSLFYMIGRAEAEGIKVWVPSESGIKLYFEY